MSSRQYDLALQPPTLSFDGSGEVLVDMPTLIEGRLLVQGTSGAGKSWFLRMLAEHTCRHVPQLIFDWEGEFGSLREIHPYVLIGRPDGYFAPDIDLQAETARLICRRLIGSGASVIVDLSDLDEFDDRREYVGLFLGELVKRSPRDAERALLVMVDEAHEFCPEGTQVASSAAMRALVSRGRKRGFCPVLATQRLSKLSKDVAECQNVVIGLTTLDVDMARSGDNLGFSRRESKALAKLEPGQFYCQGRAIGDKTVQLIRITETQTKGITRGVYAPPPAPGEIAAALEGLREESKSTAIDADRQELLEMIERLESQLQSAKEGNTSEPADIQRAVDRAVKPLQDQILQLRLKHEHALVHARLILLGVGELPSEISIAEVAEPITEAKEPPVIMPTEDSEPVLPSDPIEFEMWKLLRKNGEMHSDSLAKATRQSPKSSRFREHRKHLVDLGLAHYPRRNYVAPTEKDAV